MVQATEDPHGNHHTESVSLDRPCTYCKVLELDDRNQGGKIQIAANGKAYVGFGTTLQTIEERTAEKGESSIAAARALSFIRPDWAESFDKPEEVPKTRLKLEYQRTDALPSLLALATTASEGCAFCQVLRQDLITAWDRINEGRETEAELGISEVIYKFEKFDTSSEPDEEGPKIWLDALYVLFTIRSPGSSDEYSLHYNIYTEPEDSCASLFSLGRRPLWNDPMSAGSLSRLQQLLELSVQETPLNGTDFLPTRLLDLSPQGGSNLRLVITATDEQLLALEPAQRKYVALSYSWGSPEQAKFQLKTDSKNLDDHLVDIDFQKLPQTISDVVRLSRALGIRYLWVDALCIIQNDRDDWGRESFQMSYVYSHSFITFCIIQGDSCLSGFLNPDHRPHTVKVRFQSQLDTTISGNLYLRMLRPVRLTLEKSSIGSGRAVKGPEVPADLDFADQNWAKRGWTFQEDAIPPRKIYFGDLMFHMTSGNIHLSADGSGFEHQTYFEEKSSLREALCSWYKLVSLYSERRLTVEKDRLPAISALARTINEKFPEQKYIAGLWDSDLHRGLLWSTIGHMDYEDYYKHLSENKEVAPSWTWARCPSITSTTWPSGPTYPEVVMSSEFELQKAEILTEEFNSFGLVLQGRLHLRAKVVKLPIVTETGKPRVRRTDLVKFLSIIFGYSLWSETDEYIAHLSLDWDADGRRYDGDKNAPGPMDELYMLLIARTSLDQFLMDRSYDITNQEVMLGLLVRPVGEDGDYERLGIWYTEDRDLGGPKFWADIQHQDIKLV